MSNKFKHVAVLMGGLSAEHDVSIMSGEQVVKILNELGYKVSIIDPKEDIAIKLAEVKPDVVFNALHGTYGEDGAIVGVLETMKIPYTHSGIMASAIGINKRMAREIVASRGVKIAPGKVVTLEEVVEASKAKEGLFPKPYVIKPVQQGSSLGVHIIKEGDNFQFDYKDWKYGNQLLIEEFIPGKELSVAYFNGRALGVLELRPKVKFLDYEAKYTDGFTDHIFPAEIPQDVYKKALKYTEVVHEALGCRTVSRCDFRYNENQGSEGLYFLEINTHPGLTKYSMVPDLILRVGLTMKDLVEQLISDAKYEIN